MIEVLSQWVASWNQEGIVIIVGITVWGIAFQIVAKISKALADVIKEETKKSYEEEMQIYDVAELETSLSGVSLNDLLEDSDGELKLESKGINHG